MLMLVNKTHFLNELKNSFLDWKKKNLIKLYFFVRIASFYFGYLRGVPKCYLKCLIQFSSFDTWMLSLNLCAEKVTLGASHLTIKLLVNLKLTQSLNIINNLVLICLQLHS